MLLFALVLVLLQLGSYSGVQGQQPTSATTTNSTDLQRLTEEVAEVKDSIKDLKSILQAFGDQLTQICESLGDVERKVTLEVKQCIQNEVASLSDTIASLDCKDDETLTCNPPRVTHLGFTHGPTSSTLTCISTGSPATTVTWMRDGQPLTIDGSTYFLTHTVNYRRTTTYENVLTITAEVSSIYRHTYTCTVVNALGSDSKILTASPPPRVSISPPVGTPTAGEPFTLTCSVTLEYGGSLTEDLIVQWEAPVDISMENNIRVITADSTGTRTSELKFTPLRTSHGGQYTCKANTTTGMDEATETLSVQIPPPSLSVSRDPDTGVILRHGDPLTLTCSIQLDPNPAVDSDVVVTGKLQGPEGSNSTTVMATAGEYKNMLYIPSLLATFSDTYTCTATVEPGSGVICAQSSESSHSLNITVELLVDVSVAYTPPPGFIPGPNEYRAASGPVTVTCTAVGGTGLVSYQWSSTCRNCPFKTATSGSIIQGAVHSGDTGIHTCTATSDTKIHGSRSISFNVVGAGIHVFNSILVGSLPNNGIVISTSSTTGFRFRFFCRSDSMTRNVGILIGLDGSTVTTDDVFDIDNSLPGALRVMNMASQNALTASDQGVYTCRIPLQSGEIREINVGIYPSGFSTPPNITHLGFTHGPQSSSLTCTSSGSPATTVTWMRDGQPLTIDGGLYQLSQTVTNRSLSTYENVLTINAAASYIYRHTYTCTVTNVLGSKSKTVLASPLPSVTISSTGTLTAGKPFSFICTVTLADGGSLTEDLTVQWVTPVGITIRADCDIGRMITNFTGTRTSTLKFTPLRTSHGGQYTCKATTTAGNDSATETLTVQIPPPTLAISRDPDANVTLHHGDSLTLACTVRIDPAVVDSDIAVTGSLGGPGGRSTTMISSAGVYRITLDIPSLQATSSDMYTCVATVEPGSTSVYVQGSESHSSMDITVERLAVSISIEYSRPADFSGAPNEYRAASGPVTVTCSATGAGSGAVSYQWSSTCRNCPFQSASGSTVVRAAVHFGDTGTHTCHATQDGFISNASISFIVVVPPRIMDCIVQTSNTGSNSSWSILVCVTTGSPPTTVSWKKDRQPLNISGDTYQMTQAVTNRSSSTYEIKLTIKQPLDRLLGCNFTIIINNILGSDSATVTIQIAVPPAPTTSTPTATHVPPTPNITQPSVTYVVSRPSCGETLIVERGSGSFQSPGWPTSYPINIDCEWTITLSNRNRAIRFTFDRMYGIDGQPPCPKDYVDILNGRETDAPLLGRFCSTNAPAPLTSSIGQARVVFHAGPQHPNSSRGFRITYQAVIRPQGNFRCRSFAYVDTGTPFGPPAFPEPITANNPTGNKCTWFTYDFTGNIQLRIFYFDIPESNGCSQNSLKIYNDIFQAPITLSQTLCGKLSEYVFASYGHYMSITLAIGNRTGYRGFHAVFETVN